MTLQKTYFRKLSTLGKNVMRRDGTKKSLFEIEALLKSHSKKEFYFYRKKYSATSESNTVLKRLNNRNKETFHAFSM